MAKGQFLPGNDGRPAAPPRERFAKKYRVMKRTGCWQWKGAVNKYGRGSFYDGERRVDPARYAWYLVIGKDPIGTLQRTCNTPTCINPAHHRELDIKRHKRPQQLFNKDDVQSIRMRYDSGDRIIDIAKLYPHASEQSVRLVAKRKSYTWVPEREI